MTACILRRWIDLVISGGYEGTSGDEPGAATDEDIDAVISGDHVDEEEDGEIALAEIDRIVQEAFEEGGDIG